MIIKTDDRRKNQRYKGKNYPLSVNGMECSLVDWSSGGLGVHIGEKINRFNQGEEVHLSLKSEDGHDVVSFYAFVLRVDEVKKSMSIEFKNDTHKNEVLEIINFISTVTE